MMHSRDIFTKQRGFSLVELMIALTLGLLLTLAIGALFFANKRSYNQNELIAEMQDNARFALQALSRDLEMAGYFGGMLDRSEIQTTGGANDKLPTLAADCGPGINGAGGWAYDTTPIEFLNDINVTNARAVFNCLNTVSLVARTDIIGIRRVSGQITGSIQTAGEATGIQANTFYLRTNRTEGSLFYSGATSTNPSGGYPPNVAPMSFWEYFSHLYYIRDHADDNNPNDGIPTLCRAFLANDAATVRTECIAEGVEDMQIAFGVDTDGDGVANQYISNPADQAAANAAANAAVTVRIQLLMRATREDFSYTNNKIYNIIGKNDDGDGEIDETGPTVGDNDRQPYEDNFYRRIVQTTAVLRNPALAQSAGVAP